MLAPMAAPGILQVLFEFLHTHLTGAQSCQVTATAWLSRGPPWDAPGARAGFRNWGQMLRVAVTLQC